jgi:hypothetical protein
VAYTAQLLLVESDILRTRMTKDLAPYWRSRRRAIASFLAIFVVSFWGRLEAVQFSAADEVGGQGETIVGEVRVADFSQVQAFQFSLTWDPSILEIGEVSDFGVPALGGNSFGLFRDEGRLSVIWDSSTLDGESLDGGSILFRLSFLVLGGDGASSEIRFGDEPTVRLVVQNLSSGVFESVSGSITVGRPPLIEAISDFSMSEDQISEPIPVLFSDDATLAENLGISFTSSEETVIPISGIRLEGAGASRNLILEPVSNGFGVVEIGIRAVDQSGATGHHSLSVTILAINDPPSAENDVLVVDEDSAPIDIDVLGNDTFAPDTGETLLIESVTMGSEGGRTEIRGDRVVYESESNFFGEETFDYVLGDGAGLTASATVNVTVNSVNDPPTVVEDRFQIDEDSAAILIPVIENDSFAPDDEEILSVTAVSAADFGGSVALRDGVVFFQPAPDFFGSESFRYSVDDGNGGVAEGTVFMEVTAINDPPVAVPDGVSVPEDSSDVFIAVLSNDHLGPDVGETLVVESVSRGSSGGQVRVEGKGIFYTAPPNFFGQESFEYLVNDGNGGQATAVVNVTVVNDRADSPVARDDRFLVAEDSGSNLLLVLEDNGNGRDFDPDGDQISVMDVAFVGESRGSVEVDAEAIGVVYRPAANFVGAATLSYTVSDGERTSTGFVFITVSDSDNDPPLAFADSFFVDEDSFGNRLNVLEDNGFGADRDPEGEALRVSLVPGGVPLNGNLSVTADGTALVYAPLSNFSGVDQFPYFVSDGNATARGVVDVTVVNVDNDPPLARADRIELFEDVPDQIVDVLIDHGNGIDLDPEGGELFIASIELSDGPLEGQLSIGADAKNLFYTPRQDFIGEELFSYVLSDGTHRSLADVVLIVANVDNDPPVAINDRFVVNEDSVSTTLTALGDGVSGFDFDPEGETLEIVTVSAIGSHGGSISIGVAGRTLSYTPLPDFIGEETFEYEISDGVFKSSGEVVVLVENIDDDPPVAREDSIDVPEDAVAQVLRVLEDNGAGADFDPEGVELKIIDIEPIEMAEGTSSIAENGKSILYSPVSDFVGTESFRYTVTDGGFESVAILTVNVTNNDNDPPVARDDQFFALEDEGVLELRVLESNGNGPDFDPEGDLLTITSVPTETEGSTSISLNEDRTVILYTSSSDFFGADRFNYSISDGTNESEATVTVVVTRGDNNAPLARDDAFIVSEDSIENRFDVLTDNGSGSDSDPDDDSIRIVAVHGPGSAGGVVRLASSGDRVEYFPSPDFNGDETFSYTISDGFLTSTATVTVSVTPLPDPPLIGVISDVLANQGDGTHSLTVQVEDVDSNEDSLQLEIISDNEILLPSNRIEFERIAGGWRVNLTPVLGEAGEALVSVKVSDEELSRSQSFRFVVAETVDFSGTTAGGFLGGGVVFVDSNRDGRHGVDEPGGEIQRDGSFQFSARLADVDSNQDGQLSFADGDLVVNEGFDLWSGSPLSIQMRAPLGEQIVSPFSSLVSAVLESGAAQSLEEAAERVARMLGLSFNGEDAVSVLRLDLEGNLDSGDEASRTLVSRMAWLYSLVAQGAQLVAGLVGESSFVVSRELFLFLAQRDARIYLDCAVVEELLQMTTARFDVGVQSEVLAFSLQIICQHLDRIAAAATVVDSELSLGESLGSLHLFSVFEIERLLPVIASLNKVPDHLLFRFLPSQIDERLKDYPLSSLLKIRQLSGKIRFLHDAVSVVEDGGSDSHVILVREGGGLGSLDATLLIVSETAEASRDFLLRPLAVQFSDGELIREIDLSDLLLDDELEEGEEVAEIRLFYGEETDEAGVALVRDRLRLTLIDDESVGVFEFSEEAFSIDEDLTEKAVFVSRRGGQQSRATFDVTLLESGGVAPAELGVDFSGESVSLVFEEGEMVKGIQVPVIGDFRVEEDETVILELRATDGGLSGGRIGERRRSVLTILNDDFDQLPMIETIPNQILQEDQSQTVAFSVGDDSTPLNELTVDAFSNDISLVVVEQVGFNPLASRFSLLLRPMPNAHGEADVEIHVSDRFQTEIASFRVIVSSVNDVPEIAELTENRVLYIEDEPPVALASGLTISDVDNVGLIGATIEFTEGFRAGEDRLIFGQGGGGIIGAYDREMGVMELLGVASVEEYQAAIRRVLYDNRSENPSPLSRALTIRVRDEGLESQAIEAFVLVEAINDPPLLARVEADPLVYVEGEMAMPLSESILVATVDDLIFTEAIVKISENYQRGEDALVTGELPAGLTAGEFDIETGVLSVTGEGDLTDYQSALRSVSYVNLSDQPNLMVRGVEFLIRDLELLSEPKFREVRIVPVNDPPVIGVSSDFEIISGDEATIRLTIDDPDSEIDLPVVSIGSSNPSLIPSSSVKISRDEVGIALRFETRPGQFGEAEFKLSVTDGIHTVVRSILVTVLPKTFAPVVSGPTQVMVQEDERINISLRITDSDNVFGDITVRYQMDNRILFPLGSVMLARDLGDVEISLLPLANGFGEAIMTVFVSDGEETTEHRIEISVVSENDLPTVSGLRDFTVNPGSVIEIELLLEDVETPIDQLLFGVRPLDPKHLELLSFEIEGRGEARLVRLILDSALRETVPLQLALVDSDGGISRYPFSIFVRDGDLGSSTLRIVGLEDGSVELHWEGVGRLAIAREIDGPFLVVPDASSPFQLRATQAREFFRLVD